MRMERKNAGFSLVEIVVIVAVVGVLASLSYAVVGDISGSARQEKLNSDARTLNRAVMAYLASGGSLEGADTAEKVLARLKTEASATVSKQLPGFSSTFVDSRVSFRTQSEKEAASGDARVYWNKTAQRFELAFSGASPGIKEFILDDRLGEVDGGTEDRTRMLEYNDQPGWIWAYKDRELPGGPAGPTVVTTAVDPGYVDPAADPPGSGIPAPVPGADLLPPEFSIPGDTYPLGNYDLSLGLTNPNPAGVSALYYQVNYGDWQPYSGILPTAPGTVVSAQVVATDPNYTSSAKVDQTYLTDPEPLDPPILDPDHDGFSILQNYDIVVSLTNPNEAGISVMRYRINGGAWQEYTNAFTLAKADYPAGATVEAETISSGSPYYLSSPVVLEMLPTEDLVATGATTGNFHDPSGPDEMVSSLTPGESNSHFAWGDDSHPTHTESWLDFAGGSFSDITDGVRFNVGSMSYYNGTIAGGTGAETIDLDIGLTLDVNGNLYNPFFGFTFDLINSPNVKDDPWGSADYVKLGDPFAERTLVVEDYEYEFKIEFGETSADGFSHFDEFHVLEESTASVDVYGTFYRLGLVDDANSDPLQGGTGVATDPGTGAAGDPLYQKDGYIDPLEVVYNLGEYAHDYKDVAKAALSDAEDGFKLVADSIKDIAKEISVGKYLDAAELAENAKIPEVAAQSAETAAAYVRAAEEKALDLLNENTNHWLTDYLQRQYDDVKAKADEAAAYAAEARALADSAAADAATVATIWNDFLASGPTDDPEGFTDYLNKAAEAAQTDAMAARDDAVDALALAVKKAGETQDKIDDGRYYDAKNKADEVTAAARVAGEAAGLAETKAAEANAAATQANTIYLANPVDKILQDAQDAAVEAALATDFAAQARIAANDAAQAAADTRALIEALP